MGVKYDIVVVGAGNAGLSAAVRAAKEGKKTLLIDQHNLPGGCASSFVRGRFEFDPSVHEICDFGPEDNKGDVRKLLERDGIDVDWITVPECYRCISTYSDGTPMDISMPAGREAYIDKMEEYVPGTRDKMNDLFDLMEEIRAAVVYMNDGTPNDPKYMQKNYPNMLRTCGYDTLRVLKAMKFPQKAIDILGVYWGYLGMPLDEINFLHYSNMVHMYITRKAVIPHHTSHQISMAFMKRYYELGGEAWFNCRAEEFLFDGDRICGVKTTLGTVECDQVLANINPDIIYGKMMPKELVPEQEKKKSAARNGRFGGRMVVSYFALNKTAEELGITDYTVFMPGTADSRKEYESMKRLDTNKFIISLCYNNLIPDFSPEGTCVVSFTTMYNDPTDFDNLKPEEYAPLKEKLMKQHIERFKEAYGVDIAPYIEEAEISTPVTFARYLGTPEGSSYGYELVNWDSMISRMMMMSDEFPIKGLRHIGAASFRGDGYSSTWINGDMCAAMAVGELKEGGNK